MPNVPELPWLASVLGSRQTISVRFGTADWTSEVRRAVINRLSGGETLGETYVTTAFEDYTQAALELAEAFDSPAPLIRRPTESRDWSIRDKGQMRRCWAAAAASEGLPGYLIQSWCCSSAGEAANRCRLLLKNCPDGVVIKPRGLAASLGVFHIHHAIDIESAVNQVAGADFIEGLRENGLAPDGVIVEPFIAGPEFSIEAVVWHGCPHVLAITEKHTGMTGNLPFTELAHVVPARIVNEAIRTGADKLTRFVVRALGVWNSVIHLEFILNGDNLIPVEVGFRPAGDRIPFLLYQHAGIDLIHFHICATLDIPCEISAQCETGDSFSALIFARDEASWDTLRRLGYRSLPADHDSVGRFGCIHMRRCSSDEVDEVLRRVGID